MKLVNKGKTKDVYRLDDGKYLLKFKDDVTGEDGVFDPGADTVGLTVSGSGKSNLRLTKFFFDILDEKGVPTHYIDSNIEDNTMIIEPAKMFGNGLEIICRYRAVGSFIRRYGMYAEEGQYLDAFVEFTLKDDERKDPPITKDGLNMLGIVSVDEYEELKELTIRISGIIKEELANRGLELYDIKLEFGRIGKHDDIALIDELSGGNMRVYKDGKYVDPMELTRLVVG
ncbi:MAG: phosphoribosylaminoimidazolesuccinocarboxamide synthase [Tissierellia bacterium]|nr:phosphoribosylaminoimidazolesuccinocarboxamide synthase [Tissierellia bacterium]